MGPAQELLQAVAADVAELLVGEDDATLGVGHADDGVLVHRMPELLQPGHQADAQSLHLVQAALATGPGHHGGLEQVRVHRLGQEVLSPRHPGRHAPVLVVPGGQVDDGDMGVAVLLAQQGDQFRALADGHLDVHQQHVGIEVGEEVHHHEGV